MTTTVNSSPAQTLMSALSGEREQVLQRARDNAELTIPHLVRDNGDNVSTELDLPWESTGGYLLNNLTNKIAQSLFPVGLPWIKLSPSREVKLSLQELEDAERGALLQAIETGLAVVEREDFVPALVEDGDIAVLTRTIRQLLVAGNYAFRVMRDGKLKGYPLTRYVTERDGLGQVLRASLSDPLTYATLPEDIREIVDRERRASVDNDQERFKQIANDPIEVLTYIELQADRRWKVHQEVMGFVVDDTREEFAFDDLPYVFAVYDLYDGENFGRSYVELFIADLEALDGQSQTVQEGTAIAAQFIRLVRPGGVTKKQAVMDARTGDVITGVEGDVSILGASQGGGGNIFQGALQVMAEIRQRLNQAFLVAVGQVRQAERVTQAEILFLAQQLEEQLGGAYSQLSVSLQAPHARLKIAALQRAGRMANFARNDVQTTILTGAAALTRQGKAQAIVRGVATIGQFAQEQLATRLNLDTLIDVVSEGEGYSFDGLLLTEDEARARQERQLAQQAAAGAVPEVVRQVGQAVQQQQQAPQPAQ